MSRQIEQGGLGNLKVVIWVLVAIGIVAAIGVAGMIAYSHVGDPVREELRDLLWESEKAANDNLRRLKLNLDATPADVRAAEAELRQAQKRLKDQGIRLRQPEQR